MDSYHRTIQATTGQSVFGIYMILSLATVVGWWVITASKQKQVYIDNFQWKTRQVTRDYEVGNLVHVKWLASTSN